MSDTKVHVVTSDDEEDAIEYAIGELGGLTPAKAKEKAEAAWLERASREKGDVPLSTFEEKAERSAFERFWESNT